MALHQYMDGMIQHIVTVTIHWNSNLKHRKTANVSTKGFLKTWQGPDWYYQILISMSSQSLLWVKIHQNTGWTSLTLGSTTCEKEE